MKTNTLFQSPYGVRSMTSCRPLGDEPVDPRGPEPLITTPFDISPDAGAYGGFSGMAVVPIGVWAASVIDWANQNGPLPAISNG